jgi:iron complex transport system substrate-binding protein
MDLRYLPRRIVSLQPSVTVILDNLGELSRLVACTKYCVDVCPEVARGRIIVEDSWTAKSAEIAAAKPDLVIASVPYQEKAVSEILKSGARFLGFAPRRLADIYADIMIIAGTLGVVERGEHVVEKMQAGIAKIAEQTTSLPRRSVFCEEWGKPLIASQPWVGELVAAAGGRLVGEAGKQIAVEEVVTLDPDVLVAAWCGAGDRVPLEKIVRTRGWGQLRAVREARVYCIRDEYLNTPAPTLLDGLRALAAAIHPEQFAAPQGLRRITDVTGDTPVRESTVI